MLEQLKQIQKIEDFKQYTEELKKLNIQSFSYDILEAKVTYVSVEKELFELDTFALELECESLNKEKFIEILKKHQNKQLDFVEFCSYCLVYGVSSWMCDLYSDEVNYFTPNFEFVYSEKF